MKFYFATITDYSGQAVLTLQYTASAKHSAFLAKQYIDNCPPAAGFKICMKVLNAADIVRLLN